MSADPAGAYAATLSRFADRLFRSGGSDPGDAALEIPAERLEVYRELVRRGYTSMLRFAYPMSFRLIAAEITTSDPAPGLPSSVDAVIARFLEDSPAANHSTRHIADAFRTHFDREQGPLLARRPELADLMTLERAALGALYAFDDPGRSPGGDELAALQASAVPDFLALRVCRAPSSTTLRLAHEATRLHHRLAHRDVPEPGAHAAPERVVVSRDPASLEARFTTLDEAPFRAVLAVPPGAETSVEALAAAWLEDLPEADARRDEAWQLTTLAGAVLTGLHAGWFRLP